MKKILIVDDEPDQLGLLVDVMQDKCIVLQANRGDEALKIFLEENPDAVSLDISLAGALQGNHLLKIIKHSRPEIPVVMVTGYSHLKGQMIALGVDKFMLKPVDPAEFLTFFIERGLMNGAS